MLRLVLLYATIAGTSGLPDWEQVPAPSPAPSPAPPPAPLKARAVTSYTEQLVERWHSRRGVKNDSGAIGSPRPGTGGYPDDLDLVSSFLEQNLPALQEDSDTKTWPGDSPVQSLDDLILYHTYTAPDKHKHKHKFTSGNAGYIKQTVGAHTKWQHASYNHQKPDTGHTTTPGYIAWQDPTPDNNAWNKRPSNTWHRPTSTWDRPTSTWDRPTSSWDRPANTWSSPTRPHKPSVIIIEDVKPPYYETPLIPKPPATQFTLLTLRPLVEPTTRPTPVQKPPQIVIIDHHYSPAASTTAHPYPPVYHEDVTTTSTSTTEKAQTHVTNCGNIVINNANVANSSKEGCGDVSIVVQNGNQQLVKDVTTTAAPMPVVFGDPLPGFTPVDPVDPPFEDEDEDPPTSSPGGLVGMMTPIVDAMSGLSPAMSVLAAPLMLLLAFGLGVTGLVFPWALSSALWKRSQQKSASSHHYLYHKHKHYRPHKHGWGRSSDPVDALDRLEDFVRGLIDALEYPTKGETGHRDPR